jgi:predicted porin
MKTKLLAGAAALLIPWNAMAADLGSMGVADLEERVAELEATTARKGNRKMSLEVSGHINQAIFTTDIDGYNMDRVRIIDNSESESRFRFRGSANVSGNWSAGFLMEVGLGSYELDVRHQAVYLRLKDFGTLWLGQTSEATDGITEISVANIYTGSTLTNLSPLIGVITDETGFGVVNPFDGGREGTVTFRSDVLPGGFSVAASWNEGEDYSLALRWAGEFKSIRAAAGIGYRDEEVFVGSPEMKIGDRRFWGGSASVMETTTGLYLEGAYGNSDGWQAYTFNGVKVPVGDGRLELYAGRLGFAKKISAYGKTGIYGEFGQMRIEGESIDPRYYGAGFSQEVTGAAATFYANWRRYDLDIPDEDDANVFYAGVKVNF